MNQVSFVEKMAQKLTSLGLNAPAVLLLEAHKPLAFIASQFMLVAQPTLNLFVEPRSTQSMIDLLGDPSQLEQLISHLEQRTPVETGSPADKLLGSRGSQYVE